MPTRLKRDVDSVQSAMKGRRFAEVSVELIGGRVVTVWRETVGTCVQSNQDGLAKLIKKIGTDQAFVDAVINHVSDINQRTTAFNTTIEGIDFQLSQTQVEVLNEVVEVFMFTDR